MHSKLRFAALILVIGTHLVGCGVRVGYRHAFSGEEGSGPYAGPWVQLATSTAPRPDPVGNSPYAVVQADYQFARGPDFATLGGGLAVAPDADGWHNAATLQVAWEPWNGAGFHVSLCDGYGNWGVAMVCARWSTKGYVGFDLGAGLNPTRFGADVHETCRTGCSGSGHDFD